MAQNVGTPYLATQEKAKRKLWTLVEILMDIKDIIKAKLLFDRNNPAIILCSPELEKVFNMKALHVGQIRSIIRRQLDLVKEKTTPPDNVVLPKSHNLKETKDQPKEAPAKNSNSSASISIETSIKIKKVFNPGNPRIKKLYRKKTRCLLCRRKVEKTIIVLG